MKPFKPLLLRLVLLFTFAVAYSLRADFCNPYALTPVSGTQYGDWTVGNHIAGSIDISQAPEQLVMTVPAHSFIANSLKAVTLAATNGTVKFRATWVSFQGGGNIGWFSKRSGTLITLEWLDQFGQGSPQDFTFPVQAGDTFGFILQSGGDAINPGDPSQISLTVSNFSAPRIAPKISLAVLGFERNGPFQFSFTNCPGASCGVLASTDPALPLTNWIAIPGIVEVSPGTFLFGDSEATNYPRRFYRLRIP